MVELQKQPNCSNLLHVMDDIKWSPTTPAPKGVVVENMRRRGLDQIRFKFPFLESRWRKMFFRNHPRFVIVSVDEDRVHLSVPKSISSKLDETEFGCKDVRAISVQSGPNQNSSVLKILYGAKCINIHTGLPKDALHWLRDRLAFETAGLVSKPLFNVGRRTTRRTSNPDEELYKCWSDGPNQLIALFLQETPQQVEFLRSAVAGNDWNVATKHAHWLKSSTAAVGAAQLSELCQRIEIDIATKEFSHIGSLLAHLEKELDKVTGHLASVQNGEHQVAAVDHELYSAQLSPAQLAQLRGSKILVVEDSLVNQEVARSCLEEVGCLVTMADSGEMAIELFDEKPFDLILMDCQMGGMDGFEATRKIRDREFDRVTPRAPIIALTAHALIGDRTLCLSSGMNDYLSKPYEECDLLDIVLKWLPSPEVVRRSA